MTDTPLQLSDQGTVTLGDLLKAVVGEVELAATKTTLDNRYHPTAGRIAETNDGTVYVGDGSAWQTVGAVDGIGGGGGGTDPRLRVSGYRHDMTISDSDFAGITLDTLQDGETLNIYKSTLVFGAGGPVISDVNLLIIFTGPQTAETVLAGDGATIHAGKRGDPLTSLENDTGTPQQTLVAVQNDSGAEVTDIFAGVVGRIE